MSLRAEDFFPPITSRPPAMPTRSVRLLTGKEPKEAEMPRKKKGDGPEDTRAGKIADPIAPKKRGRPKGSVNAPKADAPTAPRKRTTGPRFGVFEDGSIELGLPECSGVIYPDDARALVGFLKRIGIDA